MLATILFHRAREIAIERVQEAEGGAFEVGSIVVEDARNVRCTRGVPSRCGSMREPRAEFGSGFAAASRRAPPELVERRRLLLPAAIRAGAESMCCRRERAYQRLAA